MQIVSLSVIPLGESMITRPQRYLMPEGLVLFILVLDADQICVMRAYREDATSNYKQTLGRKC